MMSTWEPWHSDITQLVVVIPYRRFGRKTYRSHLQGSRTAMSCKLFIFQYPKTSEPVLLSRYYDSLRAGRSGDRIPVGVGRDFPRTRPGRLWGPPSLLYNGYRVYFPGVKRPGRGVDPTSSCEAKGRVWALGLHDILYGELLPFNFSSFYSN